MRKKILLVLGLLVSLFFLGGCAWFAWLVPEPELERPPRIEIEEVVSEKISAAEGGTIVVTADMSLYSAGFVLEIPPGALTADTVITIGDVVDEFPSLPAGHLPLRAPISICLGDSRFQESVIARIPLPVIIYVFPAFDKYYKVDITAENIVVKKYDRGLNIWVDVPIRDMQNNMATIDIGENPLPIIIAIGVAKIAKTALTAFKVYKGGKTAAALYVATKKPVVVGPATKQALRHVGREIIDAFIGGTFKERIRFVVTEVATRMAPRLLVYGRKALDKALAEVTELVQVVTFPDPNLEAAISEALGRPTGEITAAAMAGLTKLDACGRGVTDLSGLEHATNLTQLCLFYSQINNINALSGLTKLTFLNLGLNRISDISALVNNPGLGSGDTIGLVGNPLSDRALQDVEVLRARGVRVCLYEDIGCVSLPWYPGKIYPTVVPTRHR